MPQPIEQLHPISKEDYPAELAHYLTQWLVNIGWQSAWGDSGARAVLSELQALSPKLKADLVKFISQETPQVEASSRWKRRKSLHLNAPVTLSSTPDAVLEGRQNPNQASVLQGTNTQKTLPEIVKSEVTDIPNPVTTDADTTGLMEMLQERRESLFGDEQHLLRKPTPPVKTTDISSEPITTEIVSHEPLHTGLVIGNQEVSDQTSPYRLQQPASSPPNHVLEAEIVDPEELEKNSSYQLNEHQKLTSQRIVAEAKQRSADAKAKKKAWFS